MEYNDRRPGTGWMATASLWLVFPLLTVGVLGGAGFLAIGILARRAAWTASGVLYLLMVVVSLAMIDNAVATMRVLLWIAGAVHALAINPAWLRDRWSIREQNPGLSPLAALVRRSPSSQGTTAVSQAWRATARPAGSRAARSQNAGAPASVPAEAEGLLSDSRLDARSYFAGGTGGAGTGTAGAARTAGAGAAEPLDLNTATAGQFEKLPGFSRSKARKALRLREARGHFQSVEDFAAAMSLQPHEFQRLRSRVVCKLPPAAPTVFGRMVDY